MNATATPIPASPNGTRDDGDADEWRAKVAAIPLIHPETLLATDYLNHFNEVIMLIDMVPDIPEMLDDVLGWKPKTYAQHFLGIGLDYGPLAAEVYDHVPADFKVPFDRTVQQLDQVIGLTTKRLQAAIAVGDTEEIRRTAKATSATLMALVGAAGAIIAGARHSLQQAEIDSLLAG